MLIPLANSTSASRIRCRNDLSEVGFMRLLNPAPIQVSWNRRLWLGFGLLNVLCFALSGGIGALISAVGFLGLSLLIPSDPKEIEDHRRRQLPLKDGD